MSAAKYALLGLLCDRPSYGYEMINRLEQTIGPAWRLNSGQVSSLLERLAQEGKVEPLGKRLKRNRQVFAITEPGKEEYKTWFAEDEGPPSMGRRTLMVKIALAGSHEALTDVRGRIDVYVTDCTVRLNELAEAREVMPSDMPMLHANQMLLKLGLSAEILALEAELTWARLAKECVMDLLTRERIWPSVRRSRELDAAAIERVKVRQETLGRLADRDPRSSGDEQKPR